MRRVLLLTSLLAFPGCNGFGNFLSDTLTLPGSNPNLPISDSENMQRVLGQSPDTTPLSPEPGNVWPGPQKPEPTLQDLQNEQGNTTSPPTGEPALPDHRQPRPEGSSTPPGSVPPRSAGGPSISPLPPLPRSSAPGPGPQGRIIQTPSGPAIDAGGNGAYRQLTTPQGPGAIMVPNGNGTSTIINPNGTVQTVPTPR